ncbi:MAG: hypothetical protein LBR54_00140, partial [Oscillospiraceae bacterium]|nr:hypothetical protein [Oscillospiraceae bacterium]
MKKTLKIITALAVGINILCPLKIYGADNDFSNILYGDVAGVGYVSISGVVMLEKHLVSPKTFMLDKRQRDAADADHDGKLTLLDLFEIIKFMGGGKKSIGNSPVKARTSESVKNYEGRFIGTEGNERTEMTVRQEGFRVYFSVRRSNGLNAWTEMNMLGEVQDSED